MITQKTNYLSEIYNSFYADNFFKNSDVICPVFIKLSELKEYAGVFFEKMYDLTKFPYCFKHPELVDGEVYFGNFSFGKMDKSIFKTYRYGTVCYDTSCRIIN